MSETPPLVLYQVIVAELRSDTGLEIRARNTFADEERAEREAERMEEVREEAQAEWEEENPDAAATMSLEDWIIDVQEITVPDRVLEAASRMEEDRYETLMGAADAVGFALLNGSD